MDDGSGMWYGVERLMENGPGSDMGLMSREWIRPLQDGTSAHLWEEGTHLIGVFVHLVNAKCFTRSIRFAVSSNSNLHSRSERAQGDHRSQESNSLHMHNYGRPCDHFLTQYGIPLWPIMTSIHNKQSIFKASPTREMFRADGPGSNSKRRHPQSTP